MPPRYEGKWHTKDHHPASDPPKKIVLAPFPTENINLQNCITPPLLLKVLSSRTA